MGQKQKSNGALPSSAFLSTADLPQRSGYVSFVPTRDSCTAAIASLFDHLVGAREQHRRHVDADRLCRLKIDDELEFCRLLNGQISWLCPL
ncbi:MAG: hypothetical protein QOJ58_5572 [Alphaproteobacteria bacterium]|jgi:hypothetical protein|nr:hypothetical protein [Alphaproteobacteria bacterium]